jgi:hypothetical protein
MGLNYFSSSPVVLPPQNPNHHLMAQQHHEGGAVLEPAPSGFLHQQSFSAKRFVPKYPTPPSLNYLSRPSTAASGRKRSRDDIGDEIENERDASSRSVVAEHMQPVPEQFNDSPMAIIHPSQSASAATQDFQSGTWTGNNPTDGFVTERPRIVARKSQRRVEGETRASFHEEIDPIVMQLGIGWKRISDSMEAGNEMVIRKKFNKNDPRILLRHEGLKICVVRVEPESAKGYWHQWWLFGEDLKSCRFLCNEDSDLFRRLSHKRQDERGNWIPDILVEGPEQFGMDVPPSPVDALSPVNGVAIAGNVEQMLSNEKMLNEEMVFQQPVSEDIEMEGVA